MANGIGQAFAALGYVGGPMAGPPLFAWSANYGRLDDLGLRYG